MILAAILALGSATPTPGSVRAVQAEHRIVALPERAGRFTHERSRVDDKKTPASVVADYEDLKGPGDLWISVHVVPHASVGERDAVAALALAFDEGLHGNPALYELKSLPPAPIRIGALEGMRQSFTYRGRDGDAMRHAGLMFHRDGFDIDVRVRIERGTYTQARFDAVADEAARQIVPNIALCQPPAGDCASGAKVVVHELDVPAPAVTD